MASPQNVKRYLAYWFQLGKKIIIKNGQEEICPKTVLKGDKYSDEFEKCWQKIIEPKNKDCYLQGTSQTIQELLSPKWTITPCARCELPVAIVDLGFQGALCACEDLNNWPNNELPSPREPINSKEKLEKIKHCLHENELKAEDKTNKNKIDIFSLKRINKSLNHKK